MSAAQAGEIGALWKHFPLCDILATEKPRRFFDIDATLPIVRIQRDVKTRYAVLRFLISHDDVRLAGCRFARLIDRYTFVGGMQYLNATGLALETLPRETNCHFYSTSEETLTALRQFAADRDWNDTLHFHTDEASKLLNFDFTADDFVYLDEVPNRNGHQDDILAIASQALEGSAKLYLWYHYQNLSERTKLRDCLRALAQKHQSKLYCFDIWQSAMTKEDCPINPGTPGCGLALANLSEESLLTTRRYLDFMYDCWKHALFDGEKAPLAVQTLIL